MQPEYWLESWNEGGTKTDFHRQDVHPFAHLYLPPWELNGKHVFVPCCGKDNVLTYFRGHAAHVTGIDLARTAIDQYAAENNLDLTETAPGRFEADGVTLLCRDVFTLKPSDIPPIDIVWDRASLIAFPDDGRHSLRRRYVEKMHDLMAPGSRMLLVTVEYGPPRDETPFSVGKNMVREYFGLGYQIDHLLKLAKPEHRMVARFGLRFFSEHGFEMTRRRHQFGEDTSRTGAKAFA